MIFKCDNKYLINIIIIATVILSTLTCLSSIEAKEFIERRSNCLNSLGKNYTKNFASRECGKHKKITGIRAKIAGGRDAKPGEFPSFVQLLTKQTDDNLFGWCGGVILDEYHILTAAHCLAIDGLKKIVVSTSLDRVHVEYYDWFGPLYVAKKWSYCKKFGNEDRFGWDVGMIRLEKPLKFSSLVQPACLPTKPLKKGQQLFTVGLGTQHKEDGSKDEDDKLPEKLQVLPVKEVSCPKPNSDEICLLSNRPKYNGRSCVGDSGSGSYANIQGKSTVYGITSWGIANYCLPGKNEFAFYANVYNLLSEIEKLRREVDKD